MPNATTELKSIIEGIVDTTTGQRLQALVERVEKLEALADAVVDAGRWRDDLKLVAGEADVPPRSFWLFNTVRVPAIEALLVRLDK